MGGEQVPGRCRSPSGKVRLAIVLVALVIGACGDSAEPTQQRPAATAVTSTSTTSTVAPASAAAATTTTQRTTTTTTAPTTITAAPPNTAAATTTTQAPGSLLQRRNPPPAAVAALLDVHEGGNGGDGSCLEAFDPGPDVVPLGWYEDGVDVVPLSGALFFCLPGFDPTLPIVMSIDSPSGIGFTEEIPSLDDRNLAAPVGGEHGANFYLWHPFPTDELGSYSIEAQQGNRTSATAFEVVDAEHATSEARPYIGPAGTEFTIGVAGFAPLEEVELHIYWINPEDPGTYVYNETAFAGEYSYITSISVATDGSGRGSYTIATSPEDPAGSYGLMAEPPLEGSMSWYDWDAEFIVERAA